MLLILTKSRVGDFWNLVRKWFKRQFDAVASSIDFTPVNNKLDAVGGKVDSIDEKIGTPASGQATDLFAAIAECGGSGDDAHNLASFFNITEATEYEALTPAEAIAIARDCQYNVMGTDWPIPTWLPTGVTEAQVESAAEGLGIPYHEPTQTA